MVLESTMICVDNSFYSRNGDYLPTRLQAQEEAVSMVFHAKVNSNPENTVGLLTLANTEVLATLTSEPYKILTRMKNLSPDGAVNLLTGLKIAHFALKHRQNKYHKMRIVAFLGSPILAEEKSLVSLAHKLKKEKVNVDFVSFAEACDSERCLRAFVDALNGKDGSGSHLLLITSGPFLTDALATSPVVLGEDEGGAIGPRLDMGADLGFDPNEDPDLAMALFLSMEDQRQRQGSAENAPKGILKNKKEDEEERERKVVEESEAEVILAFENMTEEEKIIFAMQMSMMDAGPGSSSAEDQEQNEEAPENVEVDKSTEKKQAKERTDEDEEEEEKK